MNKDQIQGIWKQIRGDVRAKWGKLTDNDLEEIGGNLEKLEGALQERYGKTREEAKKDIDTWFKTRFPRTIDTA